MRLGSRASTFYILHCIISILFMRVVVTSVFVRIDIEKIIFLVITRNIIHEVTAHLVFQVASPKKIHLAKPICIEQQVLVSKNKVKEGSAVVKSSGIYVFPCILAMRKLILYFSFIVVRNSLE